MTCCNLCDILYDVNNQIVGQHPRCGRGINYMWAWYSSAWIYFSSIPQLINWPSSFDEISVFILLQSIATLFALLNNTQQKSPSLSMQTKPSFLNLQVKKSWKHFWLFILGQPLKSSDAREWFVWPRQKRQALARFCPVMTNNLVPFPRNKKETDWNQNQSHRTPTSTIPFIFPGRLRQECNRIFAQQTHFICLNSSVQKDAGRLFSKIFFPNLLSFRILPEQESSTRHLEN